MKKYLNISIVVTLIFSIFLFSCSANTDENINEELNDFKNPNFREILFKKTSDESKTTWPSLDIRTESDLVLADEGCYTVNVRVYLIVDGIEYLVANDNVQVGDCGNSNRKSNTVCNGILPDGNYVFENNTNDEICLYEVLTKNDQSYSLYTTSINELINSISN
jgi:hypothetical protein